MLFRSHKRKEEAVLEAMKTKEFGTEADVAELKVLEESHRFPDRQRISSLLGLTSAEALSVIDELKAI